MSARASKSARVTNAAISFVVKPRPFVRGFHKGTTGPPSGDPFKLAFVFCGAARLLWRRAPPHCTSLRATFAPRHTSLRAA